MLVDAISASVRALSFIALFQAAGTAIFLACFATPLAAATRAWLRRMLAASVCAALITVLLHYLLEAGRLGGTVAAVADSSLQRLVLESPAASIMGERVLGLVLIGAAAASGRALALVTALLGVAFTFATFTQTGHTSTADAGPILPLLLWLHLVIIAFWFGALLPLSRISACEPAHVAGNVIESFSAAALWLVPFVFVAGLALASLLLGNLRALMTPYGWILLAKAAAFGAMMFLAALNRWRFGPGVAQGDQSARAGFQATVNAEYSLMAGILSLTAFLTTFLSPHD